MDKELQTALTEFAKRALDAVNHGLEQVPAVLQDIVSAARMDAAGLLAIFAVLLVSSVLAVRWAVLNESADAAPPLAIGGVIVGLVSAVFTVVSAHDLAYAYLYPRLVILDYLKHLK